MSGSELSGEKELSPGTGMKTADYYFELPKELIAQDPLSDRSASRLLVLDKNTGKVKHEAFRNIVDYLQPGDCLVLNNTRVLPARLLGTKINSGEIQIMAEKDKGNSGIDVPLNQNTVSGASIEVLLLKRKSGDIWETLVKPGKKARPGTEISFGGGLLTGKVLETTAEGNRLIQFSYEGIFESVLDRLGEMPLPPYITHRLQDKNRYQTVYARYDGSAAAPTAGLHFTPELLAQIAAKGVKLAYVTLHVGLGTFRPVKVENVLEHHMHSEYFQISGEAAAQINETKSHGGRVICVGTTSCRTVESAWQQSMNGTAPAEGIAALQAHAAAQPEQDVILQEGTTVQPEQGITLQERLITRSECASALQEYPAAQPEHQAGSLTACSGETDIFIYPGYQFRVTDGLITNFHLPESTLMMLVSALSGREQVLAAYEAAIAEKYRFFSFGDAMLIISDFTKKAE